MSRKHGFSHCWEAVESSLMTLKKKIYHLLSSLPILGFLTRLVRKAKPYQLVGALELSRYVSLSGKRLLIVGLGKGLEVPLFFSKGCASIDAIEPYPYESIKDRDFGANFTLIRASAESIPASDEHYDAVYSIATLEHVPDPAKAIKEIMRVLKPGGVVYCNSNPLWYSPNGYHPKKHLPKLNIPWFHIMYNESEFLTKHPTLADDEAYRKAIETIYNWPGYNRLKAKQYYDIICDLLKDHIPLKTEFRLASESLFPEELKRKLDQFDVRDLLTEGFCIIFRKNPSHGQSHT